MMSTYFLRLNLESDATFGRGDGVAGFVDTEVQHDEYGCPYLGGRALKGLLVNECANLLAALPEAIQPRWQISAQRLFGNPGSTLEDSALLSISDAQLPSDLRAAIARDIKRGVINREDVLESLTALRRQTAIDESGVAKRGSLRTVRVILRETPFEAALHFTEEPTEDDLALLAACIKAFRRAGTGLTRGRGRLTAELLNASRQSMTKEFFEKFRLGIGV
jgi:CRISPR/Cas system CSM-associated protein Csm3 (group 7 of RAMP superfamily)